MTLHDTTDATVWADEFCQRFVVTRADGSTDEVDAFALMVGWFANAIETGRMAEHRASTS